MKKRIALMACLLVLPLFLFAQELGDLEEVEAVLDAAMAQFAAGKTEAAMKLLEPFSLIPPTDFRSLGLTIKEQRDYLTGNYGKNLGWERASVSKAGTCLVHYMYLARHERYAIRWFFTLYNNGSGWKIVNLSYDDKIMALFPRD